MTDVSFFWLAFGGYLAGMLILAIAVVRRGSGSLARVGRGLIWLGAIAHTASIVGRAFLLGTDHMNRFLPRLESCFASGPRWQAVVYVLVFAVAALGLLASLVWRRRRVVWLPAVAVAIVVELILLDFLDFTRLPIEKVYEYLSISSWCVVVALLALSPVLRSVVLDAALAVAAYLLVVFAAIQPKAVQLQLMPALQSYWLFIHVSLTSLGFAIFGIAFVVAAMFIVKTHERSDMGPRTRRAAWLALAVALAIGLAATLTLALSRFILPFDAVAYAPHELAEAAREGARPSMGLIQLVRYGGALLGTVATVAYLAYWVAFAWLRPRDDKSGFGSYAFVISSLAFFVACLLLAAAVRRQEGAIERLYNEARHVAYLRTERFARAHAVNQEAIDKEIQRSRDTSREARRILAEARWLPLTHDNQAEFRDDATYKALLELYRNAEESWKLPIRYKDIKKIGKIAAQKADLTEAVAQRLKLPADHDQLRRTQAGLAEQREHREAAALLPRRSDGQIAAFVGMAFLLAIPIGLGLGWLGPRLRDRMPDAARLDRISYVAVAVGYPIFTFGALFAGAIWAHFAWGSWWGWDPKETGSLVAWALYTIYLHQRFREGLRPRTAAVAAMLGFLAAVLSLAGNAFLGGLHAYS